MDSISRQAAIDVLNMDTSIIPFKKAREYADATIEEIRNRIEQLPSVQPDVLACGSGELNVQSEQRWIPCSERLPEEDDYKSCIECLDGAVWYFTENGTMGLGYYYKSVKEWSTTDDLKTDGKVVAWMPLPDSFREEGEKR